MKNYSTDSKTFRPTKIGDAGRIREVKSSNHNGEYKFSKRINILNNLSYYENLCYLFDNPLDNNKTHKAGSKFEGGIVQGEIGGIEAKIELTKTRPGYLSVKESEEALVIVRNKILDDIISGRVKLS